MRRESFPARHRAVEPPLQRMRNKRGNTCIHPHRAVRSPTGTPPERREPRCAGGSGCCGADRMHETVRFRTRKTVVRSCSHRSGDQTVQAAHHIGAQVAEVGTGGCRKGTDDDIRALGNRVQQLRADRLQATTDGIANHGGSYLLADDEPEPRGSHLRRREHRGDEPRPTASRATANDLAVVDTARQTIQPGEQGGSELWLTPRARYGPSCGEPKGWRGRHGCACERGSRASWRDGGCWAGRCAWSWNHSGNGGVTGVRHPETGGSANRHKSTD